MEKDAGMGFCEYGRKTISLKLHEKGFLQSFRKGETQKDKGS